MGGLIYGAPPVINHGGTYASFYLFIDTTTLRSPIFRVALLFIFFFSCSTDRPAGRPRHDVAVRLDARALLRRPVAGSE